MRHTHSSLHPMSVGTDLAETLPTCCQPNSEPHFCTRPIEIMTFFSAAYLHLEGAAIGTKLAKASCIFEAAKAAFASVASGFSL